MIGSKNARPRPLYALISAACATAFGLVATPTAGATTPQTQASASCHGPGTARYAEGSTPAKVYMSWWSCSDGTYYVSANSKSYGGFTFTGDIWYYDIYGNLFDERQCTSAGTCDAIHIPQDIYNIIACAIYSTTDGYFYGLDGKVGNVPHKLFLLGPDNTDALGDPNSSVYLC